MFRDLVYWSVGGDAKYVAMLELSVRSVVENMKCRSRFCTMVLCDESYAKYVEPLVESGLVDEIVVTPPNRTIDEVTYRRMELDTVPDVMGRFRMALYLDCDIVALDDVAIMFDDKEVSRRSDVIHVTSQIYMKPHVAAMHRCEGKDYGYFGYPDDYGVRDLYRCLRLGMYGLNSGQFLLSVNEHNLGVLRQVEETARRRGGFMDQSAFNHVLRARADCSKTTLDKYVTLMDERQARVELVLFHAMHDKLAMEEKLNVMRSVRSLGRLPEGPLPTNVEIC